MLKKAVDKWERRGYNTVEDKEKIKNQIFKGTDRNRK